MAGHQQNVFPRQTEMLQSLQQIDPMIEQVVVYSKFVVAYLLQQDGANPGWRKANIEGPVYVVRRRNAPRFQLLVKNQFSTNDLLDDLHPDWELDCQKNYVFYKVEDPSKRIRGLWFHDDNERQRIEGVIEKTLKEVRALPAEPQTEPQPQVMVASKPEPETTLADNYAYQQPAAVATQDSVTITTASVKSALKALAEDDAFVAMVMQKLKDNAAPRS